VTTLSVITCIIASCISFVFGGVYFGSAAAARAQGLRSPQQEKIKALLDRVQLNGAAVVTDDGGETLAVVTCKDGVVQKVQVFVGSSSVQPSGLPGLWTSVGATVCEHLATAQD